MTLFHGKHSRFNNDIVSLLTCIKLRPLIDVLIIVIVSPTIMLFFIYISWQIRQRQRRQQELAPYDMVSRLQLKKFSHEKVKENEREECVICLEDYQEGEDLRVLPCQHDFHAACVDAWLTTQKKFVSRIVQQQP